VSDISGMDGPTVVESLCGPAFLAAQGEARALLTKELELGNRVLTLGRGRLIVDTCILTR